MFQNFLKGPKTAKEAYEKASWAKSVPWKIVKVFLIILSIILFFIIWFISYFFDLSLDIIRSSVRALLESQASAQEKNIKPVVSFVTAASVPVLIYLTGNLWRLRYLILGFACLVVIGSYFYSVRQVDYMFGQDKEDRFLCPPPMADVPPVISRTKVNPASKDDCDHIKDATQIGVALTIERAKARGEEIKKPTRLSHKEIAESTAFELKEFGKVKIYKSKALDSENLPILLSGPWYDNWHGEGLTIPATQDDVRAIREYYKKVKTEADKSAADEALKAEEKRITNTLSQITINQARIAAIRSEIAALEQEDNNNYIPLKERKEFSNKVREIWIEKGYHITRISEAVSVRVDGKDTSLMHPEDYWEVQQSGKIISAHTTKSCMVAFCARPWIEVAKIPKKNSRLIRSKLTAVNDLEAKNKELLASIPQNKKPLEKLVGEEKKEFKVENLKSSSTTNTPSTPTTQQAITHTGSILALEIAFVNRDPPKSEFVFKEGFEANFVNKNSDGIYITALDRCQSIFFAMNNGPKLPLCGTKNAFIAPGGSYEITNQTGSVIRSRNITVTGPEYTKKSDVAAPAGAADGWSRQAPTLTQEEVNSPSPSLDNKRDELRRNYTPPTKQTYTQQERTFEPPQPIIPQNPPLQRQSTVIIDNRSDPNNAYAPAPQQRQAPRQQPRVEFVQPPPQYWVDPNQKPKK